MEKAIGIFICMDHKPFAMSLEDMEGVTMNVPTGGTKRYSRDDIINGLQKLSLELDSTPTSSQLDECPYVPSRSTIHKRFGSWNDALREAGLDINEIGKYDDSERQKMIEDAQSINAEIEQPLTDRIYSEKGKYSWGTIKRLFGSWIEFIEEADIQSSQSHGTKTPCKCGEMTDSIIEAGIGGILTDKDIDHEHHVNVGNGTHTCDYYIPQFDLWVEVDGYWKDSRPNTTNWGKKLKHYIDNDLTVIIVQSINDFEKLLEQY